ncbi:hypothetical protein [Acinetobacter puyangensis]|uniref:hypothetical protein n=1 Tax=Acinetobacter puyangensis TaxID=1096779 RepID=UPI003A4D707D
MGTDIKSIFQKYEDNQWVTIESDFDNNHDYTLFAVLANERNYDDIVPVLSPEYLYEGESEIDGQWYPYYLTDDELLTWYAQPHIHYPVRYMDYNDYLKWDKTTDPDSYARITFVSVISMEQADRGEIAERVEISWKQDINASLSYFFEEVIRLKKLHGKIRFVFRFDC